MTALSDEDIKKIKGHLDRRCPTYLDHAIEKLIADRNRLVAESSQLRHLRNAVVRFMDGKDYHKLNTHESHMLGLVTAMGLLETKDGFVRAKKEPRR